MSSSPSLPSPRACGNRAGMVRTDSPAPPCGSMAGKRNARAVFLTHASFRVILRMSLRGHKSCGCSSVVERLLAKENL